MKTIIRTARNALTLLVCAAFVTALFLLQPETAQAQWTTPDAQNNISNTNSGNVGVGTTTPAYKFDINSVLDKAQIRFGTNAADWGGYLYSGTASQAVMSGGAGYNSGWFAKSMSASMFEASQGSLYFYANAGLSPGSAFTPTARMIVTSGGNVGIGTLIPQERLVSFGNILAGNINAHTQLYSGFDAQNNVMMEIGYGTATGDIVPLPILALTKNLTNANQALGSIAFANSSIANGSEKRLSAIGTYTDGATNSGALSFSTSNAGVLTERMRFTSNGRAGIGTTTPQDALHLFSTANTVGTMRIQGGNTNAAFIGMWDPGQMFILTNNRHPGTGNNYNTAAAGAQIAIGAASGPGDIAFYTTSSGAVGNGTEIMRIKSTGTVGIGTATPSASYKLDVQGGSINSSGGLCIAGDCKTSWSSVGGSQWANGASSSINYGAGNVGIGTTTPTQKLEVNGAALVSTVYGSSAASGTLTLQSTSSTTKGAINIGVDQTTTTNIAQSGTPGNKLIVATDRLIVNNSGVRVNGATDHGDFSVTKLNIVNSDAVQFRTTSPNIQSNGSLLFTAQNVGGDNVRFNVQNSAVSNAFVIDSNTATPARLFDVRNLGSSQFTIAGSGNVGIGTTAPSTKLHVVGDITVTGNIAAKYQDVAEWVDSSQQLAAGTVVVLDSARTNQVIASTQSYDSRVAGVISLQPGLTLGEAGEGRVLVATTGRVKIKVDATNGPISIGDLLVTSDKEGIAMKSVPVEVAGGVRMHRPGTLIGKALEPLAAGTGEILVLLSLQ